MGNTVHENCDCTIWTLFLKYHIWGGGRPENKKRQSQEVYKAETRQSQDEINIRKHKAKTMPENATHHNISQHSTTHRNATQNNTTHRNAMQNNTTQRKTTQRQDKTSRRQDNARRGIERTKRRQQGKTRQDKCRTFLLGNQGTSRPIFLGSHCRYSLAISLD